LQAHRVQSSKLQAPSFKHQAPQKRHNHELKRK